MFDYMFMKLASFFKRRSTQAPKEGLLTFKLRCSRCQEEITVKANPKTDLINQYKSPGEPGPAYILKKEVLGKNCNNMIQLKVAFNSELGIIDKQAEGAEIIEND